MRNILKNLVKFAMVLMVAVGIFGCASIAPKVVDAEEFKIEVLEFSDINGNLIKRPVFQNDTEVDVYLQLDNITEVDGDMDLYGDGVVTNSSGDIVYSWNVIDYNGPLMFSDTFSLAFITMRDGVYTLFLYIVDNNAQASATATVTFEITSKVAI